MNEDKATRYQRLNRRAHAASIVVGALVLVLLLVSGAAVRLRDFGSAIALRLPFEASLLVIDVIVVVLLLAILGAATLPFSIFRDWMLNRRYGLDRVSFRAWLTTHVKGAGLGVAVTLGALLVVQAAEAWSRRWWWVAAALVLAAAQVLVMASMPGLLQKFATLRPLARRSLGERLDRLARRAGSGAPVAVYEWHDDTAARRAQAALVGLGRTRRVLLSDTLLEAFGEDEIEIVVAHELAHHLHRDLWKGAVSRGLTLFVGFGAAHLLVGWIGRAAGLHGPADPAALPLIALAVGATTLAASPVTLALSRQQERQADAFSLELTGNPDAFISVMRRMAAMNLAEDRPPPFVELFFASHPSVHERISAARAWRAPTTAGVPTARA